MLRGLRYLFQGAEDIVDPPKAKAPVILKEWDRGAFASELVNQNIFPEKKAPRKGGNIPGAPKNPIPRPLKVGTVAGTKNALTEAYRCIDDRYDKAE
jgi:hypothetical protein